METSIKTELRKQNFIKLEVSDDELQLDSTTTSPKYEMSVSFSVQYNSDCEIITSRNEVRADDRRLYEAQNFKNLKEGVQSEHTNIIKNKKSCAQNKLSATWWEIEGKRRTHNWETIKMSRY